MESPLFETDLLTDHKPGQSEDAGVVAAGVSPAVEPGILPGGKCGGPSCCMEKNSGGRDARRYGGLVRRELVQQDRRAVR
jgi:hypothetical protein